MMSKEAEVGIQAGNLVCPMCLSLCVVRSVKRLLRGIEWVWWCGCGWTSEPHRSPAGFAQHVTRFSEWKRMNRWSEI